MASQNSEDNSAVVDNQDALSSHHNQVPAVTVTSAPATTTQASAHYSQPSYTQPSQTNAMQGNMMQQQHYQGNNMNHQGNNMNHQPMFHANNMHMNQQPNYHQGYHMGFNNNFQPSAAQPLQIPHYGGFQGHFQQPGYGGPCYPPNPTHPPMQNMFQHVPQPQNYQQCQPNPPILNNSANSNHHDDTIDMEDNGSHLGSHLAASNSGYGPRIRGRNLQLSIIQKGWRC